MHAVYKIFGLLQSRTQRDVAQSNLRKEDRAAAIYGLIGTAKLNGLNPEAYLREVLCRIADHSINRIEELLPWNLVANISVTGKPTA
jgi:IS66 C-terminal element